MKMRRDRNDRRRLAFEKQTVVREKRLSKYGSDSAGAVVKDMNRRIIAAVVALAIVLSTLVLGINVMVKAGSEAPVLEEVSLPIRVNGLDNYTTVSLQPGAVEDTIQNVDVEGLPEGVEYVRTVLIDSDGSESEIAGVGSFNGKTYYSVEKSTNVGTLLEENQAISLIYAAKYKLTVVPSGQGTYAVNGKNNVLEAEVWGDEDILIQKVEPAQDYYIDSVSYTSGAANGSIAVKDGVAVIPHNALRGDISVTIPFTAVKTYSISDARTMNNSQYYPRLKGLENHGGTSSSTTQNNSALPTFTPGGEAKFYIHSQSNSGGDTYLLNMLSVNGEDIKYPTSTTVGDYAETTLSDGRKVTVTLNNLKFRYSSDSRTKTRTLYEVKVEGFHENVEVAYNFKEVDERTLIIKGLEGIDLTGASVENAYLLNRYYTLQTNYQNIYTTYYTWLGDWTGDGSSWRPSNNLVVYTVKPGYNPYTITTDMYYNDVKQDSKKIRDTEVTGTPEAVIKQAGNATTGRYDTDYRYWGANTTLKNGDTSYRTALTSYELILTTLQNTGLKWYGLALAQNAEKNQQLYLNATPYNYHLELDLNGGTYDVPSDDPEEPEQPATTPEIYQSYQKDANGILIEISNAETREVAKHTHLDANAYVNLPDEQPTYEGKIFEGWQLQKWNASAKNGEGAYEVIEDAIYQKMDRINITDTLIDRISTDARNDAQAIRLVAKWSEPKQATRTNISIKTFVEVPSGYVRNPGETVVTVAGKDYKITFDTIEGIEVGKTAAVLNLHQPENANYYVLRFGEDDEHKELTKLTTVTVAQDNTTDIPETNQLRIYYDIKTVDLNIEKIVKGKPKARNYNITLRLTAPENGASPVDVGAARAMIEWPDADQVSVDGDALVYTFSIAKSQSMAFKNIPYGWNYHVEEEAAADGDYTASIAPDSDGTLTEDTDLVVTNTGKNPGIEVSKTISEEDADGNRSLTLESYATGETYLERLESNIPLDIAIVVDQSGSMLEEDVGKHWAGVTGNWTARSAERSESSNGRTYYAYDRVDKKYYRIKYEKEVYYTTAPKTNSNYGIKIYENFSYDSPLTGFSKYGLISRAEGNSNRVYYYYQQSDQTMHAVYYNTLGANLRYDTTLFYYVNSKTGNSISASGIVGDNYPAFEEAVSSGEVRILGSDWGYHWQTGGVVIDVINSRDTYFYPGTLYFENTPSYTNTMVYYKDDGTRVYVAKPKLIDNSNGGISETYSGALYYEAAGSRMDAVKSSVKSLVESVGAQAEENNVDHRVSIIGFANNEIPSLSTEASHIIGSNQYITTNTGIFLGDGSFKNYETPNLGNATSKVKNPSGTTNFYAAIYEERSGTFITGYSYKRTHNDSGATNLTYFTGDGYPLRFFEKTSSQVAGGVSNYWAYMKPSGSSFAWYEYAYAGNGLTNNSYTTSPSGSYPKTHTTEMPYYPDMITLTESDYQSALMSVNSSDSNDNKVNDNIETAIDNLDAYGGTYIGYGMSMANNVFKFNSAQGTDSSGKDVERKRIVVVFTDGMPGSGSSFDENAANEALASATIAKQEYDATVYTVGIFPNGALSENNQEKAENFLEHLSSGYYNTFSDVYENELDTSNSYYFTDEDGRTHSVTNFRDGAKYDLWFDSEKIGDRTIPVTKYTGGTTRQYVWKDSDGWIRASKTDANDGRDYFSQFFTVSSPKKMSEGTYSYVAEGSGQDTSDALDLALKTIIEDIQYPTTNVKLDATHAFMRDTITDNFDVPLDNKGNPDLSKLKVEWVKGVWTGTDENGDAIIDWQSHIDKTSKTVPDYVVYTLNKDGTKTLDIKNFNYSANYIAEGHEGYKLVVTVNGLTPAEGKVGLLPSNTEESGIYKINDDESATRVADFEIPYVQVDPLEAKVTLIYGGTHKVENQKFDVEFILTQSDGKTPYSGTFGDGKFSSKGIYKTALKDQESKSFSALPPKAKLTMKVSDPNGETVYYKYEVADDGKLVSSTNEGTVIIDKTKNDIQIKVTDTRQLLTITNYTRGKTDAESDYSDRTKEFPIQLTLLNDSDGTVVTSDVQLLDENGNSVKFNGGSYTFELADEESKGFYIPNGYTVVVRDAESQELYETTYSTGDAPDYNMTTETVDPQNIVITTDHKSDVIHRFAIDIVPTGIIEGNTTLSPIIASILSVVVVASGAAYIYRRRQYLRKNE